MDEPGRSLDAPRPPWSRAWGLVVIVMLGLTFGTACRRDGEVYVRADSMLNQNDIGESTPVRLRLYQLRHDGRFLEGDFDQLWLDDDAVLEDDKLSEPQLVTIDPGTGTGEPLLIELAPWDTNASYLGVIALFPRPGGEEDQRRAVISAWRTEDAVIHLEGYHLRVVER